MAKLALDIEAKKTGFAKWTYNDVPEKLWPIMPLFARWGIGSCTERTLNQMGIYSVYDLVHADLALLEKRFGVLGNQVDQQFQMPLFIDLQYDMDSQNISHVQMYGSKRIFLTYCFLQKNIL